MEPERWEVPTYVLEAVRVRPAPPGHFGTWVTLIGFLVLVVFVLGLAAGLAR